MTLEEIKKVKCVDPEEAVDTLNLFCHEFIDLLDIKLTAATTIGINLPPTLFEVNDCNLILKSLLSNGVKVVFKIDDIRLRSILTTKQHVNFTNGPFIYTPSGFRQSPSGPLGKPVDDFIQKFPGACLSEKPNNITGTDKVHLKCNCITGSIVNGVREPKLYIFALDKPQYPKNTKNLELNSKRKTKVSVLSHITFNLEGDDNNPVDFNGKTMTFNCQLIKILRT